MISKNEKKKIELPDIQQFLDTSRTMERQIKILSKTNIDDKYIKIVNIALNKVKATIDNYLKEEAKLEGSGLKLMKDGKCSIKLIKDQYEKKENILDMYIGGLLEEEKKEVNRVFSKFSNIILIAWEKFGEKLVIKNTENNKIYSFESNEIDERRKIKLLEYKLNEIMQ